MIVIAVLAILATATIVVLNPAELLRQARDTQRIQDLQAINRTLSMYLVSVLNPNLGSPMTVYLSLPDNASQTCASHNLPALPSGWSYRCVTEANLRRIDGQGWIPVNFNLFPGGPPFPSLPIDPINNASTGNYYAYVTGGSWALTTILESEKHLKSSAAKDGGYNPGKLELGSDLSLVARQEGLVGWWTFDEGSGTTARDYSGNNNNGTLVGSISYDANCKIGSCVNSNGSGYVDIGTRSSLLIPQVTMIFWSNITGGIGSCCRHPLGLESHAYTVYYGSRMVGKFRISGTTYDGLCNSYPNITMNSWEFYTITFDGSAVRCYFNSIPRNVHNINGAIDTSLNSFLIAAPYRTATLIGKIDEVRIYNRALSDVEIKAIYDATK